MIDGTDFAVLSDVVFALEVRAVLFAFAVCAEPEVAAHVVLEFRWKISCFAQ